MRSERRENLNAASECVWSLPRLTLDILPAKTPSPCFCIDNYDWTYPWPIFSNRVYFFLGSPTLTMLPERNKIKDAHFKMEIPPSERSDMLYGVVSCTQSGG